MFTRVSVFGTLLYIPILVVQGTFMQEGNENGLILRRGRKKGSFQSKCVDTVNSVDVLFLPVASMVNRYVFLTLILFF